MIIDGRNPMLAVGIGRGLFSQVSHGFVGEGDRFNRVDPRFRRELDIDVLTTCRYEEAEIAD